MGYLSRHTSLHNPDFAEYACICGGEGIRVTKADQLAGAIKKSLIQQKAVHR